MAIRLAEPVQPALSAERRVEIARMRDQDGRGIAELARLFEVSPNTIRRA